MTDDLFDLDALIAESDPKPFRFRFGGEEFTLPSGMDMQVAIDLDAGNLEPAMRRLLGDEQWQRLIDLDAIFDVNAFKQLMVAYQKHQGLAEGEAPASSSSSASTGGRSKRTSSGTTRSR